MTKANNLIPAPKLMLSLLGVVGIAVAITIIALVIKALVSKNQKEGFHELCLSRATKLRANGRFLEEMKYKIKLLVIRIWTSEL